MKRTRRKPEISWAKLVAILIVLGILAYQWYQNNRPAAQRQGDQDRVVSQSENIDQPSDERYRTTIQPKPESKGSTARKADSLPSSTNRRDLRPNETRIADSRSSDLQGKGSGGQLSEGAEDNSDGSTRLDDNNAFLQPAGKGTLRSPEGLVYWVGQGRENRIEHVMLHAKDIPGKPSHGVFDGDHQAILELLDEAYQLVKAKSRYVKSEESQGNMAYTVSLGRRIGYEGGEKGQRSGNRPLKSVRLILDGNRVITAYPYR